MLGQYCRSFLSDPLYSNIASCNPALPPTLKDASSLTFLTICQTSPMFW